MWFWPQKSEDFFGSFILCREKQKFPATIESFEFSSAKYGVSRQYLKGTNTENLKL